MSSKVHGMGQSFPFPSFFSHKCVRPCKMSSAWFCWLKVLTVKIKNLDLRPSPVNRYMTSGHKQNSHSLNNIFSRFLRSILFQLQRIQCIRDFSQIFFLGGGKDLQLLYKFHILHSLARFIDCWNSLDFFKSFGSFYSLTNFVIRIHDQYILFISL